MESIVLGDGGSRHTETLKVLLDAGADPNLPDRAGVTPLAQARARNYSAMVKLLEARKAR
jgi:ankyrin repeat protein